MGLCAGKAVGAQSSRSVDVNRSKSALERVMCQLLCNQALGSAYMARGCLLIQREPHELAALSVTTTGDELQDEEICEAALLACGFTAVSEKNVYTHPSFRAKWSQKDGRWQRSLA